VSALRSWPAPLTTDPLRPKADKMGTPSQAGKPSRLEGGLFRFPRCKRSPQPVLIDRCPTAQGRSLRGKTPCSIGGLKEVRRKKDKYLKGGEDIWRF